MQWQIHYSQRPQRIAIWLKIQPLFITTCCCGMRRSSQGQLLLVSSNHGDLGARAAVGILFIFSPLARRTRERKSKNNWELLARERIDLIVLGPVYAIES